MSDSPALSPTLRRQPDAFDWFARALGSLLGGGVRPLLRPGRALAELEASEVETLRRHLARRFRREVDPASGRVSIRFTGMAVAVDRGERRSETLAEIARIYIPPVRELLGEIDPERCRPGVCPEELRRLLAHLRTDLDLLEAELAGTAVEPLLRTLLDELTGRGGLFERLHRLLGTSLREGGGSVEEERELERLGLAEQTLACLGMALEDRLREEETGELELELEVVARCAAEVAEQAILLRDRLAAHGIGACELEGMRLVEVTRARALSETVAATTLAELLVLAEREPRRFERLAALGGGEQLESVRRGVRRISERTGVLDPGKVAERLGLVGEAREEVAVAVGRLANLVGTLARRIERGGEVGGEEGGDAKRRRHRPRQGPPEGEQAPLG